SYFNWQVLALLQILVTGGTTPELEEQLGEENVLIKSTPNTAHAAPRNRCKLSLVHLTDCRLKTSK
ncbi:potassium channel subfamily U member 1, partial [Pelobates cultripes]